ncbi:MAG: hypothetical protein AAF808_16460, partial [Cyanobacteria bacterium P01_D01_bin.2]
MVEHVALLLRVFAEIGGHVGDNLIFIQVVAHHVRDIAVDHIIPNVPTYLCENSQQQGYVLDHLSELVVKA